MELPTEGKLTVYGVETSKWVRRALRSRMAYVPQTPVFFRGTVMENLLGKESGGEGETGLNECRKLAVHAAEMAQIHARISSLEQGYDTYLADAKSMLSGGELQRLALARALCRGAAILILDEPTSALDAENERLLYQALTDCKEGRIVILCSHRQSAVQIADQTLKLAGGQIVSSQRHLLPNQSLPG